MTAIRTVCRAPAHARPAQGAGVGPSMYTRGGVARVRGRCSQTPPPSPSCLSPSVAARAPGGSGGVVAPALRGWRGCQSGRDLWGSRERRLRAAGRRWWPRGRRPVRASCRRVRWGFGCPEHPNPIPPGKLEEERWDSSSAAASAHPPAPCPGCFLGGPQGPLTGVSGLHLVS